MKKYVSKFTKLFANPYRRNGVISYGLVIVAYIVVSMLNSAGKISNSLSGQLVPICAYIVMSISLNLVVGISGELSLGHAGFMSVGAFSGVIAAMALQDTITSDPLRLAVAMLIGGIFAAIAGVIIGIPVLRLRGDYLAIVTLAFGEIIRNVLNCVYVGIDANGLHIATSTQKLGLVDGKEILSGPIGAAGITKISTFTAGFILILVALFVVQNLVNSRHGRAIMAIRDNRIAAESVGLPVTKYKLTAFVISALLAGMAGVLFAMNYSTVAPKKFDFNTSILVLVFVVLGGMGNIWGGMIATTVLTILPEMLREFSDYRMLVYAIVLILVMIAKNNPTIKALFSKLKTTVKSVIGNIRSKKAETKGADE